MIPKNNCLDCKTTIWDNNPITQPQKGNYAICMYCGCVMIFDRKLKLNRPKKIPDEIKKQSFLIKSALNKEISIEQVVKNLLIKEGHIKSH